MRAALAGRGGGGRNLSLGPIGSTDSLKSSGATGMREPTSNKAADIIEIGIETGMALLTSQLRINTKAS